MIGIVYQTLTKITKVSQPITNYEVIRIPNKFLY